MGDQEQGDGNSLRWLEWARELQEMAQTGLTYARDPHDVARYERLRTLAAEMMASHSGASLRYLHDLFQGETGYATPKVDVRGAVFKGESLLLVRERSDGRWTLPGGWADPGESPAMAVEREVREESGYQVRATRLLALYDRDKQGHPPLPFHVYKLFFACEVTGGEPAESSETSGASFFHENDLPELSLGRVLPRQIHRLFELRRHPELPTDFD